MTKLGDLCFYSRCPRARNAPCPSPDRRPCNLLPCAAAEADSPRYRPQYERALGAARVDRLRSVPVTNRTDDDRAAAKAGVRAVRRAYVEPLMALGPKWVIGQLAVKELAHARIIRFPPFAATTPGRTLLEIVQPLDAGADTPEEGFAEHYRAFRPTFDHSLMRGLPILIAESEKGPYTLAEGLTRMCCLLSRSHQDEPLPADIEVALGISPRVSVWP